MLPKSPLSSPHSGLYVQPLGTPCSLLALAFLRNNPTKKKKKNVVFPWDRFAESLYSDSERGEPVGRRMERTCYRCWKTRKQGSFLSHGVKVCAGGTMAMHTLVLSTTVNEGAAQHSKG